MDALLQEIDHNFEAFFEQAEKNVNDVIKGQKTEKDSFKESYRRLVSYQAWMSEVLDKIACNESISFFKEAQNDVLASHLLARQGAWRVALMSLRSSIENTVFGLYYLEHPVELALWAQGKHKLGFSETISYLSKHPSFIDFPKSNITGIEALKAEYATLSKAVHGSSKLFRMTKAGVVEGLNIQSPPEFGRWKTREIAVITSINLIFITFFRNELTGAANLNLRKSISLAIPDSKFAKIKEDYKITLRKQT